MCVCVCVFLLLPCSNTDVHTVASLLKLYLRELPEPVVPFHKFEDFLACTKLLGKDDEMVRKSTRGVFPFPTPFTSHKSSKVLLPRVKAGLSLCVHPSSFPFFFFCYVGCGYNCCFWYLSISTSTASSAGFEGVATACEQSTSSELQPPQVYLQVLIDEKINILTITLQWKVGSE